MPEPSPDLQLGPCSSGLRAIGDLMQSEASRLLEWSTEARAKHPTTLEMSYEIEMAAAGLRSAIEAWTDARRAESRSHA